MANSDASDETADHYEPSHLDLHCLHMYSKTSVARTLMALLPWLIRTPFYGPDSPRKQILMDILGKFSNLIINC